jgi:hypothetical protein
LPGQHGVNPLVNHPLGRLGTGATGSVLEGISYGFDRAALAIHQDKTGATPETRVHGSVEPRSCGSDRHLHRMYLLSSAMLMETTGGALTLSVQISLQGGAHLSARAGDDLDAKLLKPGDSPVAHAGSDDDIGAEGVNELWDLPGGMLPGIRVLPNLRGLDLLIAVHPGHHIERTTPEMLGHFTGQTSVVVSGKDYGFHKQTPEKGWFLAQPAWLTALKRGAACP